MPRGRQWFWFFGVIGAVIAGIAIVSSNDDDPASSKRTIAIPTNLQGPRPTTIVNVEDTLPKLALISMSCSTDAGYITCEGFVQNISGTAIKNVTAVMVYSDESGTEVSSDDALIDYDPLLPAQKSPFKVLTRYNPAFKSAHVDFKELFGGQIKTRDDSSD